MDNWHVTPRLTLQLGVRWDALPQAWERQNFVSNFNPAHYSSVLAAFWNSDHSMLSTGPGFVPRAFPATIRRAWPDHTLLPERHRSGRTGRTFRSSWSPTTTEPSSLASDSLKTSSATARPFSAAVSEPSLSACRATLSTTAQPIRRSPFATGQSGLPQQPAHQPRERSNR